MHYKELKEKNYEKYIKAIEFASGLSHNISLSMGIDISLDTSAHIESEVIKYTLSQLNVVA